VSRVLNDYPHVRPAVHESVWAAKKALGYEVNYVAKSLASGKTQTIGLIVADLLNPFYAETAKVIIEVARGRGYNVILCNSDYVPGLQMEHVDLLRQRQVDGIIFGSAYYDDADVEQLVTSGYPCIMFNRRLRSGKGSYVVVDNQYATREVTQHLIALGHRRIGFIAGPREASTAQERLVGYHQAMEQAGLPVEPALIRQGAYKHEPALRAAESLLQEPERPTAIVAGNDQMALSVLQTAGELGIQVPLELAVVGIDGVDIGAHHNIQLTTVGHYMQEMAALAATWMIEIIQDPERFARQPFQQIIRPTLIIRRTCGAIAHLALHRQTQAS
jgi:LacI family transcriptional regulator